MRWTSPRYISYTAKGLLKSMTYYTEQLMFGGHIKAFLAAVGVFFVEFLKGDVVVFEIYIAFVFFDLLLGIVNAKVYGTYRPKLLCNWMRKVSTHILLIFLFGLLCNSFYLTSGYTISAVNWLLFCISLTELASILDHLRRMGYPIPPIINACLCILRRQASEKLTSGIQDEELRKSVEEALGKEKTDVKN